MISFFGEKKEGLFCFFLLLRETKIAKVVLKNKKKDEREMNLGLSLFLPPRRRRRAAPKRADENAELELQ